MVLYELYRSAGLTKVDPRLPNILTASEAEAFEALWGNLHTCVTCTRVKDVVSAS